MARSHWPEMDTVERYRGADGRWAWRSVGLTKEERESNPDLAKVMDARKKGALEEGELTEQQKVRDAKKKGKRKLKKSKKAEEKKEEKE